MLRTVEDERSLIAHRLHDGPQQVLTAIRLLADGIRHALENDETQRALEGLERLEQLAIEAGDELRQMTGAAVSGRDGAAGPAAGAGVAGRDDRGGVRDAAARSSCRPRWPDGDDDRDTAIYHVARESSLHAARNAAAPITIRLSTAAAPVELNVSAPALPAAARTPSCSCCASARRGSGARSRSRPAHRDAASF